MNDWWQTVPAIAAAIGLLLLPGAVILAPLRLSARALVALAPPLSLASIGITGIIAAPLHLRFAWWQPLVLAVLTGAVLVLVRQLTGRRSTARGRSGPGDLDRRLVPRPALTPQRFVEIGTWALSAAVIAVIMFSQVSSPDLFSQSYDNVFHLDATVSILQTGDASSLHLRTLIETAKTFSMYPAGWHATAAAVVQMTGVSIPVAFNTLAITVCACIWLPGVGWLTQTLAPRRHWSVGIPVAVLAAGAFGVFPYALLIWGVLYPTFLAYAIFPSGLALAVVLCRRLWAAPATAREDDVRQLSRWGLLGLTAAWWIGAFFTHPRSLVSMGLLIAPLIASILLTLIARGWRAGGKRRHQTLVIVTATATLLLVCAVTFTYVVFRVFDVANRPVSEHLNGPQAQAIQTVWDGLLQVLTLSSLTGLGTDVTGPLWAFAVVVLVALVWASTRRELRWLVWAYALASVLFALAAGSNGDFTKLATGLWYKDRYRLSALLPVIAAPLVGLLVAAVAQRLRWSQLWTLGAMLLICLSAWLPLGTNVGAAAAHEYRLAPDAQSKAGDLLDAGQAEFYASIADTVPEDVLIVNDPWDGSALVWMYGGREPLFPHLNGQWDVDRAVIANRLDVIDTDPEVCAALERLNARYVLTSPGELDGGDPSGNSFAAVDRAVDAGLFTEVARSDGSVLYRIDQCRWTPAEP